MCDEALSALMRVGGPTGEAMVRCNIARIKQDRGEIDGALRDIQGVIKDSESRRAKLANADLRASYFASALSQARDRLSSTLLAPGAGVAGSKRLVIVPDGALQFIPFASLVEPGSSQPLVVTHELATLPSLTVLSELRDENSNRPRALKTLAVIADPVVEKNDPRLTGVTTQPDSRSRRRAIGVGQSPHCNRRSARAPGWVVES